MAHVERGQRHGRRQQQVIALKEPRKYTMQFRALELCANIVSDRCLEPLRRGRNEARLGFVADPLAIGLQKRRER